MNDGKENNFEEYIAYRVAKSEEVFEAARILYDCENLYILHFARGN